jgi:hypothetical protein
MLTMFDTLIQQEALMGGLWEVYLGLDLLKEVKISP